MIRRIRIQWLKLRLAWCEYRTRRLAAEIERHFRYPKGFLSVPSNADRHHQWMLARKRWQAGSA